MPTKSLPRRLYAYVEDTNVASQRLCERLGMRKEGVFKAFISFREAANDTPIYENTMQYALLRHEWLAGKSTAFIGPKRLWLR